MLKIASTDHFNRVALMMVPRIIAVVFGTLAVTSIQAMAETPATGTIPALAGKGLGITATARNWTTVTKLLELANAG